MIYARVEAVKNIKNAVENKLSSLKNKNILLSIISGILMSVSFPPFNIAIAAWVSLVPLLYAVRSSSYKEAFLCSYACGVVFFGALLYWLCNVSCPGMIILVLVLALFIGIFGLASNFIIKRSMILFSLPVLWIALEYIRSYLFTGFPWGLLGYTQYKNIPLIQIADLTGVYGVSFVIVAFNTALFSFLHRSPKRLIYLVMALILVISSNMYGMEKIKKKTIWGDLEIGVVQGNIPQEFKWDALYAERNMETYEKLTKSFGKNTPELIVWPETAYPYLVNSDFPQIPDVSRLAKELNTYILTGFVYEDNDRFYNSAALFDKNGKISPIYHKVHLVPFGEFIPFEREIFFFLRKFIDKPIGDFARGKEFTLFPVSSLKTQSNNGVKIRKTSFYKFGVLICFEDVFPYISREFVKKGADFLLNITNDAWFGNTAAAEQHLASSVFRAVENRVPVIRSANTGVSCFIDPDGSVISRVGKNGKSIFIEGIASEKVVISRGRSFYTLKGDVFVYFSVILLLVTLILEIFINKKVSLKAIHLQRSRV